MSGRALSFDDVFVYSTCPQSKDSTAARYLDEVSQVARWSEAAGCHGMLVYTDNQLVDPWLVAQAVVERTQTLRPLVAVQPVAMHPYTAAKMVASIAYCHGRAVDLNMLAGGFRNDLIALGDTLAHDERYDRTAEYTEILMRLLDGGPAVTVKGRYHHVENLRLAPALDPALRPHVLISGSSDAGLAAAQRIGATAVRYPQPIAVEVDAVRGSAVPVGVRVGILARATAAEAWADAHERFPADRRGQIRHQLAMKVSDSHWHRQLSERSPSLPHDDPYWLGPFENSQTFCPYLVGSYDVVGARVAEYIAAGFRTFILDIPASEEELLHVARVFQEAIHS